MALDGQFNARLQRVERKIPVMEEEIEKAGNVVPKPTEIDAGKVVKVNASGTGYELGEGGGSGLPPYTSADNGKVLTIGEGEESETVLIVAEQTVTIVDEDEGATLTVDFADVKVDMPAVIIINGVETETVGNYGNTETEVEFPADGEVVVVDSATANGVFYAAPGTYTVSLKTTVRSVEPKWEEVYVKNFVRVYNFNEILSDSINVISDIDGSVVEYTSGRSVLSLDNDLLKKPCILADPSVVTSPIVMFSNVGAVSNQVFLPVQIGISNTINPFVPPSGANISPTFYVKEILQNAKFLLAQSLDPNNLNSIVVVDRNYVSLGYGYTEVGS